MSPSGIASGALRAMRRSLARPSLLEGALLPAVGILRAGTRETLVWGGLWMRSCTLHFVPLSGVPPELEARLSWRALSLSLSLPSAPYLCPSRARGSGSVCWRPFGLAQRSSPHGLKVETRIARNRFGFVVACEICAAYLELSSTSSDCSSAAVAGCSPTAPGRMLGSAVALPAV